MAKNAKTTHLRLTCPKSLMVQQRTDSAFDRFASLKSFLLHKNIAWTWFHHPTIKFYYFNTWHCNVRKNPEKRSRNASQCFIRKSLVVCHLFLEKRTMTENPIKLPNLNGFIGGLNNSEFVHIIALRGINSCISINWIMLINWKHLCHWLK